MNDRILLSKSISKLSKKDFLLNDNNISFFENSLEEYLGEDKYVVGLNSGTSAIHLALILSGVSLGDEVLCQSFTFSASANPIIYQGAKPIFIDSELSTWNMCPESLEEAIKDKISKGKKPKAIILVHLYGMPARVDEILNIAKKYNIKLIEDAAEALGSSFKGQKCGTFGDFGILSFNKNKIITTFGGGALICKNFKDKQKAIFLATQARDKAPHYQHSEIGYNYRMSSVLAGLGNSQIMVLNNHISLRRDMNEFYKGIFKDVDDVYVSSEPNKNYFSNFWLTCILLKDNKNFFTIEELRLTLLDENIESRPLWKPMHLQPVFGNTDFYGNNVCENLFKTGICLPSGSNLKASDKKRIKNAINKLL